MSNYDKIMTKELENINAKYNDDTYPEYPFIAKNRVTLLRKGLYKKKNAKFRGVTAVYNEEDNTYVYPLYGMYYVPTDLVIVPEELEWSEEKKAIFNSAIKSGFEKVTRPPMFETIYFSDDSPEAKAALANRSTFYAEESENDFKNAEVVVNKNSII